WTNSNTRERGTAVVTCPARENKAGVAPRARGQNQRSRVAQGRDLSRHSPLSRLINFDNGIANGAIVTRGVEAAADSACLVSGPKPLGRGNQEGHAASQPGRRP